MDRLPRLLTALLASILLVAASGPADGFAQVTDTVETEGRALPRPAVPASTDTTDKDAPYVPTPHDVVSRMLDVANVSKDDVVFDLGSGDGRIPIAAAAQFGARAVGIEIDSGLVRKARAKAREAGVADRVEFRQKDFFNADLSEATVVALYLWPEINIKLRPKLLRELDPGDRVVSHDFWMGDWKPDRTVQMGTDTIYLWTIPEEIPENLTESSSDPR